MAKSEERKKAEDLYIKHKKTAKEIAKILRTTEKTIGRWIKQGNWKSRRNAVLTSKQSAEESITKLGAVYAEKLLELSKLDPGDDLDERERISKEEIRIADLLAKLNKYQEKFEKDNKIPYNIYVNVAEQIMNAALNEMPRETQPDVLDFFESHINQISLKYT